MGKFRTKHLVVILASTGLFGCGVNAGFTPTPLAPQATPNVATRETTPSPSDTPQVTGQPTMNASPTLVVQQLPTPTPNIVTPTLIPIDFLTPRVPILLPIDSSEIKRVSDFTGKIEQMPKDPNDPRDHYIWIYIQSPEPDNLYYYWPVVIIGNDTWEAKGVSVGSTDRSEIGQVYRIGTVVVDGDLNHDLRENYEHAGLGYAKRQGEIASKEIKVRRK